MDNDPTAVDALEADVLEWWCLMGAFFTTDGLAPYSERALEIEGEMINVSRTLDGAATLVRAVVTNAPERASLVLIGTYILEKLAIHWGHSVDEVMWASGLPLRVVEQIVEGVDVEYH